VRPLLACDEDDNPGQYRYSRTGSLHQTAPILRSLFESCARASVLGLPNVSLLSARATGLQYRDGAVNAVEYSDARGTGTLETDFVVDAMGRSSRLSDWLTRGGFEQPRLERLMRYPLPRQA
jgi:hypothetical protein